MIRFRLRTAHAALVAAALSLGVAVADEGMWPPDQIASLDWPALEARGLELSPSDIWNGKDGGLSQAIVNLEGCSAAFASGEGLVVSNYHCVYGAVQEHSTTDRNYIRDGFLARTRVEELRAKGARVLVLRDFRDVTEEVRKAAAAAADDLARQRAIEKAQKELVAACEAKPSTRCRVGAYYGGLRYVLFESLEIQDVRLAYAPPSGVGEFGGEVDNWMWPRHTGDFGIVRAYVAPDGSAAAYSPANVPFRPRRFLEVSTRGVRPGDLVMVFGYPGRTERYLPAAAVEWNRSFWYPRRREAFADWIAILETFSRRGGEAALRVAGDLKGLGNGLKNAEGMIAGLDRNRVLERRTREEAELRAWMQADPSRKARYAAVLDELDAVYRADEGTREKDFLLRHLPQGSRILGFATALLRWSLEGEKPDLEREPGYQERDRKRALDSLERAQKDLDLDADRAVFRHFLGRALRLPEGQRLAPLERALAARRPAEGAPLEAAIEPFLDDFYARTRLQDVATRVALFGSSRASLEASDDPAVLLARALWPERDAWEMRDKRKAGALARLRPLHSEMLIAWRGGRIYPDANGTLRLSLATVKGYSPRDGVAMLPQTTLAGILEKETGVPPFASPGRVLERARARDFGRYAQEDLASVPVAFLSDADTTGGNSGSPVLNGKGQLVGLNFDRVFENVAGDYGWSPEYSRNVSVDVRYLLWILERVEGADALLRELSVPPEGRRGVTREGEGSPS